MEMVQAAVSGDTADTCIEALLGLMASFQLLLLRQSP